MTEIQATSPQSTLPQSSAPGNAGQPGAVSRPAVMVGRPNQASRSDIFVHRESGQVQYMDVTCECGKITRIYCEYEASPDSSTANP